MKHTFLRSVVLIAIVFMAGCSIGPSVCDDREQVKSYLCDTADNMGVKLEDAGNILMLANAVAIGEGVYTADDAIQVYRTILTVVNTSPSYSFIQKLVMDSTSRYPGLFILANSYIAAMDQPQIISKFDKDILTSWIEKQITILGG